MTGRLQDKVALITGAGSGIGAATSRVFAEEGAKVAVSDVNQQTAETVVAQITGAGGEAFAMSGDVSSKVDAERMVNAAIERYGRLDVLVNSAGVSPRHAPDDWDFEQSWSWVIDVNLKGTYLMSWFATHHMKEQGNGSVVNLSSIYGLVGRPSYFGTGYDPYPHSKGGVSLMTKDMANALGKHNVRINALCPGFIYTPFTETLTSDPEWLKKMEALEPMGRIGQPEEVAKAALFLASDDASFITGVCLPVDGGYTSQ